MKLLLTSSGITNDLLADTLEGLVGKQKGDITFGIINEAYAVEPGNKFWMFAELNELRKQFSGSMDFVNLLALSEADIAVRLRDCDVIYVLGGNTDYLQHVFDKSGFSKLLPQLLESKVYVGSSAGSMVLGKRVGTAAYAEVYGESDTYNVEKYLEFVGFALKPHLNSSYFPNNRLEVLERIAKDLDFTIYAIDDETAIQVVDNEVEVVSKGNWKVYEK